LGDPAYRDGEFGNAAFKAPAAVAVSKDGKFLYVADMGNDAIRRVSFEQRSRVDTLAGGPGKAELLSPTALALYSEGSALFTIAGKAGLVMKVRTDNGQVSPVPNAVSPVAATSLLMHPSADRLYALDARTHRLTALETATGRSVVLDMADPGFDLQGSLATNGQELYFLQAATGQLHRLAVGTAPLVGLPLDGLTDQKLAWERLGYLGNGAKGVVVDQGLLWVWDQTSGQFKRFNPATGIWADYPLRDFDGEWLVKSPPMPRSPFRPDPLPEAKRRPMFKGPLGMASDAPRNLFYIAEAQGNRILGLGHPSWEAAREDGMPDYVNAEKVPGVIRILLLGDSMSLSYDGEAGELPTVEGGFGKRLEAYLNAFSSLKGKGKRYEVLQQSVAC
jgi:hypothetical protein